MAPLQLNDIN
jgi:hypothetical protein